MYVIVHNNLHDINIVTYLGSLNFIFVVFFIHESESATK